jgi:hypothetical protein
MSTKEAKPRKESTHWKRQDRNNGKFDRLNPCELCKKSAGDNYFSDERCNTLGPGLVLCQKCANKVYPLDDVTFLKAFGFTEAGADKVIKRAAQDKADWEAKNAKKV